MTLNHRPPKSWSCHTAMKKHVSNENKSLYEDPTAVYMGTTTSLVSVQTPMYSTRAVWKKRPMLGKFDRCVSQKEVTS